MKHVYVKPQQTWETTWTNTNTLRVSRKNMGRLLSIGSAEIIFTDPYHKRLSPETLLLYLSRDDSHLYRSMTGVEKRRRKNALKRKRKEAKQAAKAERKRRRRMGKIAPGPPYDASRACGLRSKAPTPLQVRRDHVCSAPAFTRYRSRYR